MPPPPAWNRVNKGLQLAKIFDDNLFNPFTVKTAALSHKNYMKTNLTTDHRSGKKVSQVELNVWQRTGQISDTLMQNSKGHFFV